MLPIIQKSRHDKTNNFAKAIAQVLSLDRATDKAEIFWLTDGPKTDNEPGTESKWLISRLSPVKESIDLSHLCLLFQQTSTWGKFFEVWDVIGVGFNTVEKHTKYLVVWKGYNYEESSWVEAEDLGENITNGFSLQEFVTAMNVERKSGNKWEDIFDAFLDEVENDLNAPKTRKRKRNNAHSMALATTHMYQHVQPSKLEEYLKNHHPSREEEVNDAGKWSVMPQLPLSIPEKKKLKKQEMLIVMTQ